MGLVRAAGGEPAALGPASGLRTGSGGRGMRAAGSAWMMAPLVVCVLAGTALGYPRDDAALVEVDIYSRDDIHRLNDLSMDITTVRGDVALIAAIPEEVETLWANGFSPRIVLGNMRDAVMSLGLPGRGEYHSYSEITSDLAAWAAAYPSITELISIGQSHQGREIWALKITDNPDTEEAEPEIQWVGCHHGDETISVEVPYYIAEHLLENYGTDPEVTWLVDNREFWIIPMLNPDGHTAGSRYNAQGTDLNRNYLCPCRCNAGTAFSAPESRALRDFNVGMNPVTSLTFHSGAVCVNYLWDYSYDPTPDEPMIITLSNGYASYNGYWVTNGADWYIVHGSCQDWCYDTRGEVDWTIELCDIKDPPSSYIDPIYQENRDAMLYLARHSGHGIRGVVADAETGDPLYATMSIPEIGKDVYTDPDAGDYHRMVEDGTYTVISSAEGYTTSTVYNVSAGLDTFVVVDFELEPLPRGAIAGYVYDDEQNPLPALVQLTDIGGFATTADSTTGYYEIDYIPVGYRDVKASLAGYVSVEWGDILVQQGTTTSVDFTLPTPLFHDDMESGLGNWVGDWGLTSSGYHSPSFSMTDSPSGNYPNHAYLVMTLAHAVDLTGADTGRLRFWHRYETEAGYDHCLVGVSTDGGSTWTGVASYDGTQLQWVEADIDITDFVATDAFKVRFILDSDGWVNEDGWYVDDVQISGDAPSDAPGGDVAVLAPRVSNYPNPFNPRTTVHYTVASRGDVDLLVYNASGRLVRTLIDGVHRDVGSHDAVWDGLDDRGRPVAAGVYLLLARTAAGEASSKMVLLE